MTMSKFHALFAALAAFCLAPIGAAQAEIVVNARGVAGWESTDTRVAGANATTNPDIDSRIQFDAGPAGSDGSLKLISPASNDKATLAYVDANGLGGLANFTASYRWFKDSPVGGAPAPALKLGIRTSDFGSTPPSSMRIGENNWDKVMVYEPYDNPDAGSTPVGTWVTQTITANSGTWSMFNRTPPAGVVNPPHSSLTLSQWLADATWGTRLTGAVVVDVALGVGSGNANTVGYVDWLETSAIAGGERINFTAVPEPASIALLGAASIGLVMVGRRRA
jgi:hypothetical protein